MYAATTRDKGNAADGRFSTACYRLDPAGHVPAKWANRIEHGKIFIRRELGVSSISQNLRETRKKKMINEYFRDCRKNLQYS